MSGGDAVACLRAGVVASLDADVGAGLRRQAVADLRDRVVARLGLIVPAGLCLRAIAGLRRDAVACLSVSAAARLGLRAYARLAVRDRTDARLRKRWPALGPQCVRGIAPQNVVVLVEVLGILRGGPCRLDRARGVDLRVRDRLGDRRRARGVDSRRHPRVVVVAVGTRGGRSRRAGPGSVGAAVRRIVLVPVQSELHHWPMVSGKVRLT